MDKEATLKLVEEEYQKLRQAIDGLDADQMQRVWFGEWSVKDMVAHILGWEKEMTAAMQRMARGERPTPEGVDYTNFDGWNEKFSQAFKQQNPATVLAEWAQTHMNYVKAAEAVPADRFGERDGKPQTVNRLIVASGYGHYQEHGPQILEWRKTEGI